MGKPTSKIYFVVLENGTWSGWCYARELRPILAPDFGSEMAVEEISEEEAEAEDDDEDEE